MLTTFDVVQWLKCSLSPFFLCIFQPIALFVFRKGKWISRKCFKRPSELEYLCGSWESDEELTLRKFDAYFFHSRSISVFQQKNTFEDSSLKDMATQICFFKEISNHLQSFCVVLKVILLINHRNRGLTFFVDSNTSYDKSNVEHETALLKLWDLIFPNERRDDSIEENGIVSKSWKKLGFQGTDPSTDFRGGGVRALQHMLYLAASDQSLTSSLILHAEDEKAGFFFALLSIHLSVFLHRLAKKGFLEEWLLLSLHRKYSRGETLQFDTSLLKDVHLMNSFLPVVGQCQKCNKEFGDLFIGLMAAWLEFWRRSEPGSIMDFERYTEDFYQKIERMLSEHPEYHSNELMVEPFKKI
eukprot:GCRY01001820.1.p1 GENE.GCRY01001820.1~~GCRY01001820.1.p1  ORF type:complete len:356 (+),score=46.77 GCRY01001820.1:234-1301(+)